MTTQHNTQHPPAFYHCPACGFGKVPNLAAHEQSFLGRTLYQSHCLACGSTITIGIEIDGEYEPNHELSEWRDEVQS